jgi:peptidoglycan/xylan/chitin deacetylase (PgdA/CDA1 family)
MKKIFFSLLYKFGITRLAAWCNRKRIVILCFHGVTERGERNNSDHSGLHIRAHRFDAQLNYLQSHYRVISLADFRQAVAKNVPCPERSVVLTFDDGYRNFLTAALPRLTARRMPVSIFLITERIQTQTPALRERWSELDDEQYLSWEEVRALHKQGIEIGSHTCSHRKLSELTTAEAKRELHLSQETLAKHLPQDSFSLAYPYGAYSETVIGITHQLKYSCALTTDAGTNTTLTDKFLLRRNLIGDDDDEAMFAARVSGLTALIGGAVMPWRWRTRRIKSSHLLDHYADKTA